MGLPLRGSIDRSKNVPIITENEHRCARNCFSCPVCTAPLSVTTLENTIENSAQQGPWILSCGYCMWTTLDVGIKFNKPTNIRSQLSRIYEEKGHGSSMPTGDSKSSLSMGGNFDELESLTAAEAEDKEEPLATQGQHDHVELDTNARFAALKRFYTKQIEDTSVSATDPLASDFGAAFSSPSALSRIMSIYTSSSHLYGGGAKKAKSKPPVMREAFTPGEGVKVATGAKERSIINRMASEECTWDDMLSKEQRAFQDQEARFMEELRPLPVLLRTKRSKRCKSCKHILVKPEIKPASTRFRIRLIALSYIPLPTLRPLMPAALPGQSVSATSLLQPNLDSLTPLRPIQYLLTLKNHMFDPVKVTLATPSVTPGRIGSKVTILCPQFDLGANSDVWDEALQGGPAAPTSSSVATLTSSGGRAGTVAGYEKVAEAGKVWDKGRNWTTVVLEVVPEVLPGTQQPGVPSTPSKASKKKILRTTMKMKTTPTLNYARMKTFSKSPSLYIWNGMRKTRWIKMMERVEIRVTYEKEPEGTVRLRNRTRLNVNWRIGWCLVWVEYLLNFFS